MKIRIEDRVISRYPTIEIGYLVSNVAVNKNDPYVASLKQQLLGYINSLSINSSNFAIHPSIAKWRKIYNTDFNVKESTYRSSIESLVRRVVTGKELWNINSVVDIYNCCSIFSLLPMGGYDTKKISGDIELRYAKEFERFRGIGEKNSIEAKSHHLVYADEVKLMCWLWNHKDSAESCIDEKTKQVIFFVDSIDENSGKVQDALKQLSNSLERIKCVPLFSGILNKESHFVEINLPATSEVGHE